MYKGDKSGEPVSLFCSLSLFPLVFCLLNSVSDFMMSVFHLVLYQPNSHRHSHLRDKQCSPLPAGKGERKQWFIHPSYDAQNKLNRLLHPRKPKSPKERGGGEEKEKRGETKQNGKKSAKKKSSQQVYHKTKTSRNRRSPTLSSLIPSLPDAAACPSPSRPLPAVLAPVAPVLPVVEEAEVAPS